MSAPFRPTPPIIEEFIRAQADRGCFAPSAPVRMRRILTTFHQDNGEEALIHAPLDSLKTGPTRSPRTGGGNKRSCVQLFRDWHGSRLEQPLGLEDEL